MINSFQSYINFQKACNIKSKCCNGLHTAAILQLSSLLSHFIATAKLSSKTWNRTRARSFFHKYIFPCHHIHSLMTWRLSFTHSLFITKAQIFSTTFISPSSVSNVSDGLTNGQMMNFLFALLKCLACSHYFVP